MQLSTKHKLSLSLALAVCLCAPISTYAANSGGTGVPDAEDYTGAYLSASDSGDTNDTNVFVDSKTYTQGVTSYTITKGVYGGRNDNSTGTANNNTVRIAPVSDFVLSVGVFGGIANGDANGNTVEVRNSNNVNTKVKDIYGGSSANGTANENTVSITNVTVTNQIYGGSGETEANDNKVKIYGANTTVQKEIYGGYSNNGTANRNEVTIIQGNQFRTEIYGGYGKTEANDNIVKIAGATTEAMNVFGGKSEDGIAKANQVIVTGGKVQIVVGGMGATEASNNQVNISGNARATWHIVGGRATANGDANDNSVVISGGQTVTGNIIGGWLAGDNNAINNTITIKGTADIVAGMKIYGGYSDTAISSGDIRTGNTLNIYKSGVSVTSVDNFQHYDLAMARSATTLKVSDSLTLLADDTITSTRVLSELNVGDTVTLLASSGTLTNNATLVDSNKAEQGILYKYGYELIKDDANNLISAKIISKERNSQATSVADGQLAAMGMLRSGADLVASSAMDNAAKAHTEYDTFAAMNYTKMSMDSVSSVDVQGSSMLVGMGRNIQHTGSNLTIGAFLEAGWGTYESALGLEARAKGHTNYYGVGVLARNNADSGIYTEGSIRVGKVGNTYSGNTEADGTYDVSSTYYGLHLGIGKINKINDTTSTDIYAKYFYAHEGGTSANIAGDNFEFDSIDSHRVRIGGRLNSLNKNINRYVGLAYEYEFSGKATATAYGLDIATPTAKGSSGILELGLVYKPTTDSKFSMDMGMNGYVGKRKGVTGNVTLNWGF